MDKHSASANVVDTAGVAGVITWMTTYLTATTNVLTMLIGVATLVWAVARAYSAVTQILKDRRAAKAAEN